MAFPPNVWDQIKGISKGDLISALERDGFKLDTSSGSIRIYIKNSEPKRRVGIHYHKSSETFRNPGLLRGIITDAGWTVDDMRRLKLIK